MLAKKFNGVVISSGDVLRKTDIPGHARQAIDSGELSPTDVFREVVTPYLAKKEFDGHPLLLSTVGRMHGEEQVVIAAAEDGGHPIKAVIFLEIEEIDVWQRFEAMKHNDSRGQRVDDDIESIKKRLKLYGEKTLPVIEVYRKLGLLDIIDGRQSPVNVYQSIIDKLYTRATK